MIIKNLHIKEVEDALKLNDGYCPCKLIKNHDSKCMCRQFRDKIELKQEGQCECGLYEIILQEGD